MKLLKTKCGKLRPNKTSKGITETLSRNKRSNSFTVKEDVATLSVYGTTDELRHGMAYLIKTLIVQHPTDAGYSKKVYILNDKGKSKAKRKIHNIKKD